MIIIEDGSENDGAGRDDIGSIRVQSDNFFSRGNGESSEEIDPLVQIISLQLESMRLLCPGKREFLRHQGKGGCARAADADCALCGKIGQGFVQAKGHAFAFLQRFLFVAGAFGAWDRAQSAADCRASNRLGAVADRIAFGEDEFCADRRRYIAHQALALKVWSAAHAAAKREQRFLLAADHPGISSRGPGGDAIDQFPAVARSRVAAGGENDRLINPIGGTASLGYSAQRARQNPRSMAASCSPHSAVLFSLPAA